MTVAGAQLRSADDAKSVHKDGAGVKTPELGSLPSEHMLTLQKVHFEPCRECGQRDQGDYDNSNGRFYCYACWNDYGTHKHILATVPDIWNRWRLHARIFRPDEVPVRSSAAQSHLKATPWLRIPEIPPAQHTLDSHISARWQVWLSRFPFIPGAAGDDDKCSRTWHFQKRYRPLIIAFLVWAAGDVFHYPYWSPYDVWHSNGSVKWRPHTGAKLVWWEEWSTIAHLARLHHVNVLLRRQHTLQATALLARIAQAYDNWGLDTRHQYIKQIEPDRDARSCIRGHGRRESPGLPPGTELCYPDIDPFLFAILLGFRINDAPNDKQTDELAWKKACLFWLPPLWSLAIGKLWGLPVPNFPWAAPDMSLRPYIAPYSRKQPDRTAAYVPWPNVYQGNPELALVYLYGILLNRMHAPSFDAACQLALMMGRHPRLGATSPLRDLDDSILQCLAMKALAYQYDDRIMLALDEMPSGLGTRRTSRLLQALPGREELFQGDAWIRSFAFTTPELRIFFLMGQRYYKFPLPTQQVGDGAPPRSPLPNFWDTPKTLQPQAYAELSEVFGLRQQGALVSVRQTVTIIPRHMHLIELRQRGVIALTTLVLHLTFCPTVTIAALWQQTRQAWDNTADLPDPPPPSEGMQPGSCYPLSWTEPKILEMVATWLARPKPYPALRDTDTNRQSSTGPGAWVLDTLALFLGPAVIQDLVPGLRYLHTVRLHRGHPHIGSLVVAPQLEANGQPQDNWMLAAWLHATETHSTPVLPRDPRDPRNFEFVPAFEQQREATAEWGFRTL